MTNVQWKDWAVDESGDVLPLTGVLVRDAEGNVATLYSDEAGTTEISNPTQANDPTGDYTFFAAPGLYTITIGVGEDAVVRPWNAVSAEDALAAEAELFANRILANRAAAEAATVPALVTSLRVYSGQIGLSVVEVLHYVEAAEGETNPALTTADGRNWVPAGTATPDHWAENSTPGTTNMTGATNLAIDWAISQVGTTTDYGSVGTVRVEFLPGQTYYFASTLIIEEGKSQVHLDGRGARIVTDTDSPLIRINESYITLGGDVAGSTYISGTKITDFTFQNTNLGSTTSRCITAGKANDWYIDRCHFIDFHTTLDLHRSSNLRLTNSRFWLKNKMGSARAFVRMQGVNEGGATLPGGGTFVELCEFIGLGSDHTLLEHCIELNSSDGFYMDFCHLIRAQNEFTIAPDGSTQNNKVTDVKVAHTYFDGVCNRNVFLSGSVTSTGTGLFQDIEFVQCLMRGGFIATHGLLASVTDAGGFVSAQGGIEGLKITACKFRQHNTNAISIAGAVTSKVPFIDVTITDSDFRENAGATAVVSVDCLTFRATGNAFGPESSAPGRAILANMTSAGEQSVIIANNDLTRSTYSQRPWEVTGLSGGNLRIGGNLVAGGNAVDIDQVYAAETSNYNAAQLFTYDFDANSQAVSLNTEVLGTDTTGDNYFQYEYRVLARRSSLGVSAVVSKAQVVGADSISNNQRPVDVVMLTGPAWSAQTYSVGDLVTNAGNVYMVITSTGASATAPTHTAGAALLDGTTRFLYLGATNANRLALIVSAENTMTIRWAAHVSARGAA